jgi:hypothetical protein
MLLGDPVPPPYASLALLALVAAGGAWAWWRFGIEIGMTVILIGANIGLVFLGMNLDQRRQRRRLRASVESPAIDGGVGEVLATGDGQVDIRAGVGLIEMGAAAAGVPAPGWYDLYWLRHPDGPRWSAGRILLSAKPLPRPPATASFKDHADPTVVAEVRARLREVLRRTDWELGCNRAGTLSPPQRDELRRQARGRVRALAAWVTIGALVSALFLVAAILTLRRMPSDALPSDARDDLVGAILGGVLGLVVLWFTVRGLLRLPPSWASIGRPPALLRASGTVTATLADSENDIWAVALAGGPTFRVTANVARALRTSLPYTVYYVADTLLAAEPAVGPAADGARPWPRPDWVVANAAGQLTADQRTQIVGERLGWRSAYVLLPVLLVVAAAATPYISHHFSPKRIAVDDGSELVITVSIASVIVAIWAALMVRFAATRRRRSAAVVQPEILTSSAEIVWSDGGYRLRDAPDGLSLSGNDDVLPEPGHYRLYWLRTPRPTLLSAEPQSDRLLGNESRTV